MKYASAEALRDALETRLGERARKGESIGRLRKQVAFERLLRRLQQVAPDVWLLKGGFALDLRLAERARATRDIDIDWTLDEEAATAALIDAARVAARGREAARLHAALRRQSPQLSRQGPR